MKIVIFEGLDRTGKNSAITELNNLTNYRYPTINRFLGSCWVYGTFYRRDTEEQLERYIKLENKLNLDNYLLVYLHADSRDLIARINDTKETDIRPIDIGELSFLYSRWLAKTKFNKLVINTSENTVFQVADKIWSHLKLIDAT